MNFRARFPASTPPPAPRVIGWRGRHMVTEGGRPTAWVGAPAIIPAYNDGSTVMTEAVQRMSYDLMKYFCPGMDAGRWRTLHKYNLAMTNNTGFDDPDGSLFRDYINGQDLTAEYPKYDKARTFQGSYITGTLNGNLITCVPGIDGIDATKPMPSTAEIVAKHWYSVAVNTGDPPHHFRPNWGGFIAYPFILSRVMTFRLEFFSPWDSEVYPNPITTYNPA